MVPTWLALIVVTIALILYSITVPLLNKEAWMSAEHETNRIRFPLFVITAFLIIILFTLFLVSYTVYV